MTVNEDLARSVRAGEQAPVRIGLALLALGLAALIAVLDGTVVATTLGELSTSLDAPLSSIIWVTVAYLLATASMLPLLGWAMAHFGGRRVFLTGLGLFVLGSALSALAWSAPSLIAFRVVQGMGGGLLEPSSLALAAALAPRERIGRVLGAMSMIINIAPVLGPIVGALLLETGHWQWIFIINLPLGAGVLAAALAFLPKPSPDTERVAVPGADARGLVLLTVGFVAVLFALNRSGQNGAGWAVAVTAVLGAGVLALYGRHALQTQTPAFDLRLLRRPGFAATLAVMGLVGFIMYTQLTVLPLFAAEHHDLHGLARGLLVCALGAGLLLSMSTGARLSDRTGPRPLVRAGSLGTAAGLALFAATSDRLPLAAAMALFVGIGLCFGFTASPTFASIYRTLRPAEQPQGTTALFMTVQLTASIGVTVVGLVQTGSPEHWPTITFTLLALSALTANALSGALPGRPQPADTSAGSPH